MAEDILYKGGNDIGGFTDNITDPNTGDLRRKYDFGSRVSELNLSQDPFFRLVSKLAKKPTDDPEFKFTERRGSWHKRYAYVMSGGTAIGTAVTTANAKNSAGDTIKLKMGADYKSAGNVQNILGQKNDGKRPGQAGTQPEFFMVDQIVRVPVSAAANGSSEAYSDYLLVKITAVDMTTDTTVASLTGTVVRGTASGQFFMGVPASLAGDVAAESQEKLAPYKAQVVGTVFDKGTGYPDSWKDQPFRTAYGMTQIWKTSMAMTNTDRATVLKYEANEWSRIWKEKLIEHKFDIEQSLLFGSQSSDYRTTQGAVDWIMQNGNLFSVDIDNSTIRDRTSIDGFLDNMSALLDPRYNNSKSTVFFCSTQFYNYLHKLGGFFATNMNIDANVFRADLAVAGRKKVLGLDMTTISTVYGDMNVTRNIHLDGTDIHMLGINLKNCAYRPLVGNGVNRDTSVYVGVQTLENSGVDRRVDQILTEAGMEWSMPESHAVWKKA